MDVKHPYTYIRALYNLFVCSFVGVFITVSTVYQKRIVDFIKTREYHNKIIYLLNTISTVIFLSIVFNLLPFAFALLLSIILILFISLSITYFVKYDEYKHTEGLTAWSIAKAKELFKGKPINDREGKKIIVRWKIKEGDDNTVNFSENDMKQMAAETGDLVYISDARKYLGGLKSVHAEYGTPHNEDGIVYINNEHKLTGLFIEGKLLSAEKEM
jgi:SSS family solute:Na+ symporter